MTKKTKQLLMFAGMIIVVILVIVLFSSANKKSITSSNKSAVGSVKSDSKTAANGVDNQSGFLGEKGTKVEAVDGKVYIEEKEVDDDQMHAFNYYSEKDKKTIYFFIVKASDGTYRAAANACEVCFGAKKGFKQVGDLIRCENCRVTYSKDKIALEKGGCNPGPIDKNVSIENGKLMIDVSSLEEVAYLFS